MQDITLPTAGASRSEPQLDTLRASKRLGPLPLQPRPARALNSLEDYIHKVSKPRLLWAQSVTSLCLGVGLPSSMSYLDASNMAILHSDGLVTDDRRSKQLEFGPLC